MKEYMGKIIDETYKIGAKIGQGGTADVYKGENIKTGQDVAIKIMRPGANVSSASKRFAMEAEILRRIDNPNVLKLYEYYKGKTISVMIIELVEGKDLKTIIKQNKSLSPIASVSYTLEILNALEATHRLSVMHRDLKPQNLMLGYDGALKLMDFGIAQVSEDQELTKEGHVIGTIAYLAPEIIKSQTKANPLTEIYSVGIILYEMLVGKAPFYGTDVREVAASILKDAPIPPTKISSKIDKRLSQIVMKMIERDPYNRYQDIESIENDLREWETSLRSLDSKSKNKKVGLKKFFK